MFRELIWFLNTWTLEVHHVDVALSIFFGLPTTLTGLSVARCEL